MEVTLVWKLKKILRFSEIADEYHKSSGFPECSNSELREESDHDAEALEKTHVVKIQHVKIT